MGRYGPDQRAHTTLTFTSIGNSANLYFDIYSLLVYTSSICTLHISYAFQLFVFAVRSKFFFLFYSFATNVYLSISQ